MYSEVFGVADNESIVRFPEFEMACSFSVNLFVSNCRCRVFCVDFSACRPFCVDFSASRVFRVDSSTCRVFLMKIWNQNGYFPETVWQKSPYAFMRSPIDRLSRVRSPDFDNYDWKCLFIEDLKSCNVTQVNKLWAELWVIIYFEKFEIS